MKEQVRSFALYLAPLNSDIDITAISVNDISVGVKAPECQCSKILCTQKNEEVENGRMCRK